MGIPNQVCLRKTFLNNVEDVTPAQVVKETVDSPLGGNLKERRGTSLFRVGGGDLKGSRRCTLALGLHDPAASENTHWAAREVLVTEDASPFPCHPEAQASVAQRCAGMRRRRGIWKK